MDEKKKLLYINTNPFMGKDMETIRRRENRHRGIVRELERSYQTEVMFDFLKADVIGALLAFSPDALLTHFPYDPENGYSYGTSIEKLRAVRRERPETPIVIYTGADKRSVSNKRFQDMGVKGVVRKADTPEEDVEKILTCLEDALYGRDFKSFDLE